MSIVKYFVGPTFDRVKFVDILRRQMNVAAGLTDDGIYIDRDAFSKVKGPAWVEMNREDIMSNLHTRAATEYEIFRYVHKFNYMVRQLNDKGEWVDVCGWVDLDGAIESAKIIAGIGSTQVLDLSTGEIMWDNEAAA